MEGREEQVISIPKRPPPHPPQRKRDGGGWGMDYMGWRVKGAEDKSEFPEFQESQNGTGWKLSRVWEYDRRGGNYR